MAIRSLLLSLALTFFIGYAFTLGVTNENSFIRRLPTWSAYPLILTCGVLYLLAFWWAIQGFNQHKITALFSIGFCLVGFAIFAFGISMELGKNKPRKGQYDYDFTTLHPTEKAVLTQITNDAGLTLQQAVFTEHWHLADSSSTYRICVQKGHITGLNLSNHPIKNLSFFSQLPQLAQLYLQNCNLADMSKLKSSRLDRLDVSNNFISDLNTLHNCPNIRWLFINNNLLQTPTGKNIFKSLIVLENAGNPLMK
jgi:hypothetical protein